MVVTPQHESKVCDLSVIICAHNEERHIRDQLDALVEQQYSGTWEIVVVDNNSTDSTARIVSAYADKYSHIRYIGAHQRANKSYAMSVGVSQARADKLLFCDADDVVASGWVSALAEGLSHYSVVTGPHELDLLNPSWLASSRGRSAEDPCGSFFGIFPTLRGANWATHRSIWSRLGGMPEDYPAGEDAAFSLSCWLEGIEVKGIENAIVHYRYRESSRDLWRQGLAYGAFRPRLARRLVDAERPRPPRFSGWKPWLLLILRVPTLVTRRGRAVWVWIAANRIGQVIGSTRARTILL